jgi:hypothetical protein
VSAPQAVAFFRRFYKGNLKGDDVGMVVEGLFSAVARRDTAGKFRTVQVAVAYRALLTALLSK